MNKAAIKNFAVWARRKLISDISYKAGLLGITENGIANPLPQSTNNVQFFDIGMAEPYSISGIEIKQRKNLVEHIENKAKGSDYKTAYTSVIEEVAYTWFNRLIAIRFMEVNDYLPSHVRVLSSESGKQEPDIVTNPFDAELSISEDEKANIAQLKLDNKLDELFRILFIKQCNALYALLPKLFENLSDYTELLLNISFIDVDGVVSHLVNEIPEDDFNVELGGQVEIIGWLYQYYNTELKDETFNLLKSNVKVTKERIPSATQLFTPDWIVRYMVENSLGRIWYEGHKNEELKGTWKYYLDEAEQEPEVQDELNKIYEEHAKLNPEDIKVIDPCMGSGHILVYAFDVLMQIYESAGYTQRDAAKLILERNIYGLDIDDRAAQLAYFAVMMKARKYNRRILAEGINCNIMAIQESNTFDKKVLSRLDEACPIGEYLIDVFYDAKEYGSILNVDTTGSCLDVLERKLNEIVEGAPNGNLIDQYESYYLNDYLSVLIKQARVLLNKYEVVVTNPPYKAISDCDDKLATYAKLNYPNSKSDLSTICMEKLSCMLSHHGLLGMINIPVWMTIISYEKLREFIYEHLHMKSLLHFGRGVFGSDFGSVAFVLCNSYNDKYVTTYKKLYTKQGAVETVETKEQRFWLDNNKYVNSFENYYDIPGKPVAYWATSALLSAFANGSLVSSVAEPRQGMSTCDVNKFSKVWYEVDVLKTNIFAEGNIWIKYNKGGSFRKWYGNKEYVVFWNKDGGALREAGALLRNKDVYFQPFLAWTKISSMGTGFRFFETGSLFDGAGGSLFFKNNDSRNTEYTLGMLNSCVGKLILSLLSPTLNFNENHIGAIPLIISEDKDARIRDITAQNIEISRQDWDSFETSWDFKKHPLI